MSQLPVPKAAMRMGLSAVAGGTMAAGLTEQTMDWPVEEE